MLFVRLLQRLVFVFYSNTQLSLDKLWKGGWMWASHHKVLNLITNVRCFQRMKAEGKDVMNPVFSEVSAETAEKPMPRGVMEPKVEVCMTKEGVDRKITAEEIKAQDREKPWVRTALNVYYVRVSSYLVSSLW